MEEETDEKDFKSDEQLETILLSPEHRIILSIPLDTSHVHRRRQLVIISAPASPSKTDQRRESLAPMFSPRSAESPDLNYCMLGVDTVVREGEQHISLGFVLKILWGTETSLDGDGGFGVHILSKHYMFKPTSLQFLWTVIQTLHAITSRLTPKRHSLSVLECDWVKSYQTNISSPQSCINEWNEMSDILSRRPVSPDQLTVLSSDQVDTETLKTRIKSKLREIMKTVDLDDITSKSIRLQLEAEMGQNLNEFKGLIDEEILLILGQMDPASKIFDFLYLGSEWNASNLEELNENGVTHILNVTREIDNFFPAVFNYLNIREYDVEETDLLQYWDTTYRFIRDCVQRSGVCLVHCKMGISRSASTVMAFAMKHFSWSLEQAMKHTKDCRSIVNPNPAFRQQLVTYEGILNASRQRNSFRKSRPKSSTRSKSSRSRAVTENSSSLPRSPSEPNIHLLTQDNARNLDDDDSKKWNSRPVSWSPHSKFLVDVSSSKPGDDKSRVEYHCYSQLSQYLHDPLKSPCPAPITATPSQPSSAPCKRFYSLPGQTKNDDDDAHEDDDIKDPSKDKCDRSVCPRSKLSQCTCDLELELSVSEIPVDLFEETPETIKIMKNIGNLPLQIRDAPPQHKSNSSQPAQSINITDSAQHQTTADEASDEASDNTTVIVETNNDDQNNTEDTMISEELSVKTLANMFDFRLSDPSMTKSLRKLIKESKVDSQCYPSLPLDTTVNTCSDC